MSKEQPLKLARRGEWRTRAIELLEKQTHAFTDIVIYFVDDYWLTMESDEYNLLAFDTFQAKMMSGNY